MSNHHVIQKDTTWTDPYYDLTQAGAVVFPDVTLTIQGTPLSPVVVAFGGEKTAIYLQASAKIVISNVKFVGDKTSVGVGFLPAGTRPAESTAQISHLFCTNMTACVDAHDAGMVNVTDSVFVNNSIAVKGLRSPLTVRDSVFVGHDTSVDLLGGSINAQNCIFLDSSDFFLKLDETYSAVVQKCLFSKAKGTAVFCNVYSHTAHFDISSNVFAHNKVAVGAAYDRTPENTKVSSSLFIENQIGVAGGPIGITDSVFFGSVVAAVSDCCDIGRIDGVTFKNNNNKDAKSWNAANSYWGTDNVDSIRSKIHDIFQDPTLGLVTIEPLAEHPFPGWNWTPPASFLGVPLAHPSVLVLLDDCLKQMTMMQRHFARVETKPRDTLLAANARLETTLFGGTPYMETQAAGAPWRFLLAAAFAALSVLGFRWSLLRKENLCSNPVDEVPVCDFKPGHKTSAPNTKRDTKRAARMPQPT
ncbi:expressed unknown protein [Seminavis robusta]|uniref:Right handed beta helix domain-containing protein n=1 Tax=Seminavis robusta TaxID=568900 RepID=A0A9N8EIB2_9STRA|nr:expressed unknown protein [Seminavis robusta]|eukprot:Sro999_g229670.1 n/a (472) ;mRNA; f:25546-27033